MEDYKKKYEELEFLVKNLYPTMSDYQKEKVEGIIPELAESDDEKIRKAQLDYWRSVGGKEWYGVPVQETIAWLEKQGEKSIIIDIDKMVKEYSQTKDGDFGLPVNCMIRAYRQGINDALRLSLNLEKQGEQKHNPCDGCINCKGCINCESGELRETEQNSAWSEEDEERIEQICEDLKCGLENFRSHKNVKGLHFDEIINSNIAWLKSLKDRVQPQPKQEWSEEDLKWLREAISIITQYDSICKKEGDICHTANAVIDWIKSIKPQPHWKPSEYQMKWLEEAIPQPDTELGNEMEYALKSLYDDLQKL